MLKRYRFIIGFILGFGAGGLFAAGSAAFLVNYYPDRVRQVANLIQDFSPDDLFDEPRETVDVGDIVAANPDGVAINILESQGGDPLDLRLLGGNFPAWLGDQRIDDPTFIETAEHVNLSLIRVPGGSWSNYYDWLACERDGLGIDSEAECYWPWAATPSDFIRLSEALGTEMMYTVKASDGGTPQEAAALVAFYNGDPSDMTVIGFDDLGHDWGTVGQWAQLRVDRGYTEPGECPLLGDRQRVLWGQRRLRHRLSGVRLGRCLDV